MTVNVPLVVGRIGRRVVQRLEIPNIDIGEVDELAGVAAGPESGQLARVGDRIAEYEAAGPADWKVMASLLALVMSTTPSPTSAVPPLTTPMIAIVLPAPLCEQRAGIGDGAAHDHGATARRFDGRALADVPPFRFNCVPLVTSTSEPDTIVPPWMTLVPLTVSITALLPFVCSLPPEIFAFSRSSAVALDVALT